MIALLNVLSKRIFNDARHDNYITCGRCADDTQTGLTLKYHLSHIDVTYVSPA